MFLDHIPIKYFPNFLYWFEITNLITKALVFKVVDSKCLPGLDHIANLSPHNYIASTINTSIMTSSYCNNLL